jgi:hypothetical protein
VDAMLATLTAKQFAEIIAFKRIEPFSAMRADVRIASLVCMIANVNRGPQQKPYKIEDFLLQWGEKEVRKQSAAEQLALMKLWTRVHNELEAEKQPVIDKFDDAATKEMHEQLAKARAAMVPVK